MKQPPPKAVLLLVDDDADLRGILELALMSVEGVETVCAGSGEDALAIALARHVDFVLTDFRMDGMTGIDLLRRLRESGVWPPLGAVLMSGEDDDALAHKAAEAGATKLWRKPLSVVQLRRFVGNFAATNSNATEVESNENQA